MSASVAMRSCDRGARRRGAGGDNLHRVLHPREASRRASGGGCVEVKSELLRAASQPHPEPSPAVTGSALEGPIACLMAS